LRGKRNVIALWLNWNLIRNIRKYSMYYTGTGWRVYGSGP
jgi:hypothetical protein